MSKKIGKSLENKTMLIHKELNKSIDIATWSRLDLARIDRKLKKEIKSKLLGTMDLGRLDWDVEVNISTELAKII
jgi:hypothetical protein